MLEISRAEVSGNLLDFDYSHCNVNFTHVNTMPPEYRPSPLKRITNQDLDSRNHEQEVIANCDPNDDRKHVNQS